jgi:hypothetical protein
VDDDGMPVQQSSAPSVHPLVNSNGVDHGGVASYAVNHAYDNQAVPGDILFWKYREWKNIGHTSVITKASGWTLWYSQHSGPRRNQKLQDQLAVLNAQGHGPVTIYIAHLGNR